MAFDLGLTLPFCDTPERMAIIGAVAGLLGGAVGLAAGLDVVGVVALAGTLAVAGEVAGHAADGGLRRWVGRDASAESEQ
jgi:hypothetical protein